MEIQVKTPLMNLDGKIFTEGDNPVYLGDVIIAGLLGQESKDKTKLIADITLCQKIKESDVLDIPIDDVVRISNAVAASGLPFLIKGLALQLLSEKK